jgi:hypothetical protein
MRRIGCNLGRFVMSENGAVIILFTRFKPAAGGGGSVTCGRPSTVLGARRRLWLQK